jgi:hypothetical protein
LEVFFYPPWLHLFEMCLHGCWTGFWQFLQVLDDHPFCQCLS